jgi:hypothetical protein
MTYIVILWVMIACSLVTGYQHATNDNTYNKIMTEEWSFTVNSAAKLYVSFYSSFFFKHPDNDKSIIAASVYDISDSKITSGTRW